jgi:hypothetical protein
MSEQRERRLREKCRNRMVGLVEIAKRLRDKDEDGVDFADAAFIVASVDDFAEYVALLRGIDVTAEDWG